MTGRRLARPGTSPFPTAVLALVESGYWDAAGRGYWPRRPLRVARFDVSSDIKLLGGKVKLTLRINGTLGRAMPPGFVAA